MCAHQTCRGRRRPAKPLTPIAAVHTPFGACADNGCPSTVIFGSKARRHGGAAGHPIIAARRRTGGGEYAESISRLATLSGYPIGQSAEHSARGGGCGRGGPRLAGGRRRPRRHGI